MSMKISLKDWLEMQRVVRAVQEAIEVGSSQVFALLDHYHKPGEGFGGPEVETVMKLHQQLMDMREQSGMLMDTHVQSRWLGGDSDDPRNHTLEEPNCCPMPRRHFTREEIAEAGMVCEGPCQWRKKDQ